MKIVHDTNKGAPGVFSRTNGSVEINAGNLHFRELNAMVKSAAGDGVKDIHLRNVYGQRYIGSGVRGGVHIDIEGVPGNDLGAFMDGPEIVVHRNVQDGVGNTMNDGSIIVHGRAGDIIGMGMRGGKILIKESVGYRAAIHMKEYRNRKPLLMVGRTTQDFLGEYMAGGVVVVLDLEGEGPAQRDARHIGTGMHGGVIFIRGSVEDHNLGQGVTRQEPDEQDLQLLRSHVAEFTRNFGGDIDEIMQASFQKLVAESHRPFGDLYAY
ncbi:MAG: GltB/FmdC/FwdC-like GXGXG domain-containing protein [Candidatus Geothermincolia bacterium]